MQLLVDQPRKDLRSYNVARQLHMLTQLRAVFTANEMAYPMFYDCLEPRAKSGAKLVLMCLRRRFCTQLGVSTSEYHPFVSMMTELILSYLSFPEFAPANTLPPRSLYVQLGAEALSAAVAAASQAVAAANVAQSEEASTVAPLKEKGIGSPPTGVRQTSAQAMADAHSPGAAAAAAHSSAVQDQTPARQPATGLAATASLGGTASPVEQLAQVWEKSLIYRPMFFVRPYVKTQEQAAGTGAQQQHQQGDTAPHEFFIRMAHTGLLNEESLNPYFGRYGQVSCELLQRVPLTQCAYINEEVAYNLTEMFNCAPHEVLIQDFIVSADSSQNAERAVLRAYYKELLFIAFHERVESEYEARRRPPRIGSGTSPAPPPPISSNNCYAIVDVDTIMAESAAVYRLLPTAAAVAAVAAAEDAAAVGTWAGRRRARREERRQRKRERRERRHRQLGAGKEGTALLSDAESESSADSSSSGSSSDGGDGAGGALAGYIPHVVIDGFPYWMTEDQLKVLLQNYGTVKALRLSVDDLSGAFTGAVLLEMSTIEEAIKVSDGLHGFAFKGFTLRAGVLNEKLELESLVEGEKRDPPPTDRAAELANGLNAMLNERLWV